MYKYIIDIVNKDDLTANGKARYDVDNILVSLGYEKKNIRLEKIEGYGNLIKHVNVIYNELKGIIDEIPNDSDVIIQYPWPVMSYKYASYLNKVKIKKNLTLTIILHDINSLRPQSLINKLYYKFYVKQFKFFDVFDYIICHTDEMKKYLEDRIGKDKIIKLGIFDYLLDFKNVADDSDYKSVVIAGNLDKNKSGYVYNLNELNNDNYHFELFGINYCGIKNNFIHYNGSFKSEELPKNIKTGFGLVWDGTSLQSCNGSWGEYLKWNSPHKFSLYMSCGIPVIIWEKSALSNFVVENGLGFVISSLDEIEEKINNIAREEYANLLKNVSIVQDKVINGEFLKNCLNERKF